MKKKIGKENKRKYIKNQTENKKKGMKWSLLLVFVLEKIKEIGPVG